LSGWFRVVKDYADAQEQPEYPNSRIDLEKLGGTDCLTGHFNVLGGSLFERYPEMLPDKRFFLFSMVRDPLERRMTAYYYAKKWNVNFSGKALSEELRETRNIMAGVLGCTEDDYREVLGRYDFIGLFESIQESVSRLALRLDKPICVLPHLNISQRDAQSRNLPPGLVEEFRESNRLDYSIYEYCRDRFSEQGKISPSSDPVVR